MARNQVGVYHNRFNFVMSRCLSICQIHSHISSKEVVKGNPAHPLQGGIFDLRQRWKATNKSLERLSLKFETSKQEQLVV